MRTEDAINNYVVSKKAKGLSAKTLEIYNYRFGVFRRHFSELPEHPGQIESFLANPSWEPETRDTVYRLLKGLYGFLVKRGYIALNPIPAIEPPLMPRKIPPSLTTRQLRQLLEADHPRPILAFILLIADTGMRLGEAFSVNHPSHFTDDTVIVNGKTGEREIPVDPGVRDLVCQVLPWPWKHSQSAGIAVKAAFLRAGIHGRRLRAHSLRHTFSRAWKGDESVLQEILGHTTNRMIKKIYRPYDIERAKEQHRIYSPVSGKGEVL